MKLIRETALNEIIVKKEVFTWLLTGPILVKLAVRLAALPEATGLISDILLRLLESYKFDLHLQTSIIWKQDFTL